MDQGDEKLKELKEAFDLYDQQNTNYVGMTELKGILLCLGINVNSDDIFTIMDEYGENKIENAVNVKKISFNKFLEMMKNRNNDNEIEEELMEIFRAMDKKGNGLVGYDELKYILLCLGENFQEEEIMEMINQADSNGKGAIDYKDFVKIIMHKS